MPPPAASADPGPAYRGMRRIAGWFEELHRIQSRVVDLLVDAPDAPSSANALDDALLQLMRRAAAVVLKHPVAAQAAFAALVAEGRAFAKTEEGARLDATLRHRRQSSVRFAPSRCSLATYSSTIRTSCCPLVISTFWCRPQRCATWVPTSGSSWPRIGRSPDD